jgi:hypothetical protein
MGLKLVPAEHVCYDRKKFEHIWWMAQEFMAGANPALLEIDESMPAPPGEPE